MDSIWTDWFSHPDALIGLAIFMGAYLFCVGPLRERYELADEVEPRQVATFTLGVLVIFFAEVSPLHILSEKYLFSAHMVQHMLLMLVAAPLLIMGTPGWLLSPLLRSRRTYRLARVATHPLIIFASVNILFSIWHIPALYDATVAHHWLHLLQHLLFIATSILMWWPIVSNVPELPRWSYPVQMVYLFLLSIAQIIVFAAVTFAREPLYEVYVNAPRVLGVDPLVDQQVGGIIMKIGSSLVFMPLVIIFFYRWFGQEEEKRKAEAAAREYFER